ncbi:hypothetical protein HMPREF1870_01035 [Bacteroidales bacterium KA00344]|nr:hypothetical protein HMPREF1870_01035 [Bacteroidales bacterium KA00344]
MKKISLYLTLAIAGLFTSSCNDDYADWAAPQSNPQEAAITIPGFKASAVEPQTLTEGVDAVPVFALTTATLPEGYALGKARVELTPQGASEAKATVVNTTLDGHASKADLQALIEQAFGKNPVARKFDAQVYLNAVKNGQAALIDAGKIVYTVTTVKPDIAEAYYIIGGPNDWAKSAATKPLKFSHSETNVYDDPVFTITFPVDATKDTWFAIGDDKACDGITNKNDWSMLLGTTSGNGKNGETGSMERRAKLSDDGTFMVPAGSRYVSVTINMMEYTYTVKGINFSEFIYEVGNNSKWGEHPYAMYGPNSDGKYYGAFYLDGEFKFKPNGGDDWSGDWEYNGEGKLTADGSQNIPAPETGFYFVTVDLTSMSYTLKPFKEMHVVGDALVGNADQWGAGVTMTWNAANKTWEAKGVKLEAGKSIKFKDGDGSWSGVNLGGSLGKLIQGSNDNIPVAQSGTFDIILHLENTDRAPYAELKAK